MGKRKVVSGFLVDRTKSVCSISQERESSTRSLPDTKELLILVSKYY